ncbi:NAD(P)H-dependent oxidoreductase [Veillonella agrestimuris]|uniref:NAD(P)H-dependent oxidoreductase n=1 Tax=Veillonella agrestimuris TaxID=2941340 RepID=UPI00203B788E|nr:NAD(P)H-dependent oxidoreductase [Veillonella agrestimuris]
MSQYIVETKQANVSNLKREDLLNAMLYRHACKKFDPTKIIGHEDWSAILEAARLTPTSLGFEPFKLLVIQNKEIRQRMAEFGWGIQAGLEASHFVAILARKKQEIQFDSPYIRHMVDEVKQLPEDIQDLYKGFYKRFTEEDYKTFESERAAFDWTSKQAYIVLGNMLTMAAYEGIDSCPLEGFHQDNMTALLGDELGLFDTKEFGIAVMAAFGYRAEEPRRPKTRRTMDEIVEII